MRIYCTSGLPVKQYVLDSNVDGVSIEVAAYSLFGMGAGYNNSTISAIKKEVKRCKAVGKDVTLAIPFGSECGRMITDHYPCLEMVYRNHGHSLKPGQPVPIKVPVPYNAGYKEKVRQTIEWVSNGLKADKEVWEAIDGVKVTGSNRTSSEMAIADMDWTGTESAVTAYSQAADKWKREGYLPEEGYNSSVEFINLFYECFAGKNIIQCYIPGLNGFPCVDGNGRVCLPKYRPHTTDVVLDYGRANVVGFESLYTAYVGKEVMDDYVQVNSQLLGGPVNGEKEAEFAVLLDNAREQGKEYLEVFDLNVLQYPTLFKK